VNAIINTAIEHFRVVILCLTLIFLGGTVAYIAMPKEDAPEVIIPIIYVHMRHEGISPEDSARLLVKPMETTLRTLEGLKHVRGIAQEDGASIVVEFNAGIDPDKALLDVREEVDKAKSELPDETDEPTVSEVNFSQFPVINLIIYGDLPERPLYKLAENLKNKLEQIPSVLEANISGNREDLLEIIIDPLLLESYQLSHIDILNVVQNNNKLVAAGQLDSGAGRFSVKIPGVFETALDVYNLPIKIDRQSIVTLSDVAEIRRTFKDPESYSRFNGQPAITISVSKRTGENVLKTVAIVRALVEEHQKYWPENVQYSFVGDQSLWVEDAVTNLQNSIISAILLVAIAIVAALGARSALLVSISIPGSFLLSIYLLYIFGFSINQVVMFALILSVGLLVDGAIVVSEYADRKMHEGLDRLNAYRMASQRMAWPIMASTATTLAAFFPLLFWPGVPGQFMKYMPITLIFTLTASFLMALIFMPTLGSRIGKKGEMSGDSLSQIAQGTAFDPRKLSGFTGIYIRLVDRLIKRPILVSGAILSVMVGIFVIFASARVPVEFFPEIPPNQIILNIHARGNLSLDEKDKLVRAVESRIQDLHGIESLQSQTLTRVETGGNDSEDLIGKLSVDFIDWRELGDVYEVIQTFRDRTENMPGIFVEIVLPDQGPAQGKDLQIEVSSENPEKLLAVTNSLYTYMDENVSGITDLENTLPLPGIQWELKVDRALAGLFNTDLLNVGSMVQLVTNGIKVGEYRPDDAEDEVDIRVRFPEKYRNLNQLDEVRVYTPEGTVPITNFVQRVAAPKISSIERVDTMPTYKVKANVTDQQQRGFKVEEITEWIEEQNFGPDVNVEFVGQDAEQKESEEFLIKAFSMALFLMALILVTQFNSFYHAGLILLAVLLSTAGVLVGIMITGRSFQIIMTGVGVISLAGIVVNNNIVLIDTYARLKDAGMDPFVAIVQTVAQRLRPVMLTTITTVLGLMPMAFMVNIDFAGRKVEVGSPGSFFWVDLSIAVSTGLIFATVLTLLLTPSMLAARTQLSIILKGKKNEMANAPSLSE